DAAVKIDKSNVDNVLSKISGSYYGLASFVRSMGPSFASIFVGIILSGVNEGNSFAITFVFLSVGIFYLIAFLLVSRIKLSEESFYSKQLKEEEEISLE
ncbi:unnamed protein product, partial [marine sediment metagenome]